MWRVGPVPALNRGLHNRQFYTRRPNNGQCRRDFTHAQGAGAGSAHRHSVCQKKRSVKQLAKMFVSEPAPQQGLLATRLFPEICRWADRKSAVKGREEG